jgi:hypothetical protein
MEVSGDFVAYAQQLPGQHNHLLPAKNGPKPSHNDYLALALAKQETCTLLTGDANLRIVANKEQVNVMGTIGLLCAMIENQLLSVDDAFKALDRMKSGQATAALAGSRKSTERAALITTSVPARAWATENPEYWKQYRDENPAYAERNRNLQQQRNQKLRTSVIANEDVSRPLNQLPAGRYRWCESLRMGQLAETWIVEITVLAAIGPLKTCDCK